MAVLDGPEEGDAAGSREGLSSERRSAMPIDRAVQAAGGNALRRPRMRFRSSIFTRARRRSSAEEGMKPW